MGTLHLSAGYADYDKQSGDWKLSGGVRVESESSDDLLEFREGSFNPRDRTATMFDGVIFLSENNFHIQGAVIKKTDDYSYRIEDFTLSTCDNHSPSWSITGSELSVVMEGYGTLKNAAFRIKNFPVFYLPYMIFPAKTKRQTGLLLPQFDYSDMNGYGFETPLFWAISDNADATLYERYLAKRGLVQGLEFRYRTGPDSKGEFLFDALNDKIGEKDLSDRDQAEITPFERTNQGRYWLRGRLDQEVTNNITARLDMDLVSDQDYLREFEGDSIGLEGQGRPDLADDFGRPFEERLSSFRRSAIRVSHDGEGYSLQGSGYYYQVPQDQADDTAQPLAGIFYSIMPRQLLESPLFFSMNSDYNYNWREDGVKGNSLSFNPEITYPKQLGDYLKFNSSFSYTGKLEHYDTSFEERDSTIKDAYGAEISLSTVIERVFAFDWKDVGRLKHQVTPILTYEYRTVTEDDDKSPWFDPMDSGSKKNRIGFSIENLLDAALKDANGTTSYRQWAWFDIIQRFNLEELQRNDIADSKKEVWDPLLATVSLKPFKGINFKANTAWDHYRDRFATTALSSDLSIPRSGDAEDTYSIDYIKDSTNNKSINLRADVNLISGISAGLHLNRDLDLKYNIHNSLWLRYQAQCWSVKFIMEKEDSDRSISLNFQLAGF